MARSGAGRPFQPHQIGLQRDVDPTALKSGAQATLDSRALAYYRGRPGAIRDRPVQVDAEGYIYDGHHRCRVAAEMGLLVDVQVVDVPPGGRGIPVLDMPVR